MTEIILATVSALIIGIYIMLYVLNRGLPTSISETYYHTESRWFFPLVISASSVLAWIPMLNHTPEQYQFLAFLICVAILFVAASPAFKEEFIGKVHAGAAIILGIAAVAWVVISSGIPYATICGVIVGIANRKNFIFWLEAGILIDIYMNLFVLLHICSSAGA